MDATTPPDRTAEGWAAIPDTPTGAALLRSRANDYQRREQARKKRKARSSARCRWLLTLDELAAFPLVAAYLDTHDRWLPSTQHGVSKARVQRLEAMRAHTGPLVLLTAQQHALARRHALKTPETAAAWRKALGPLLKRACGKVPTAYDAVLQSGAKLGGRHTHVVIALYALRPDFRQAVQEAPAGTGGGVLLGADLHAVLIDDTAEDRKRVAAYLSRNAEGRFDFPDDRAAFLTAHEEELVAKQNGQGAVRLKAHRIPKAWGLPAVLVCTQRGDLESPATRTQTAEKPHIEGATVNQQEALEALHQYPDPEPGPATIRQMFDLAPADLQRLMAQYSVTLDDRNGAPKADWARLITSARLGVDAVTAYTASRTAPTAPPTLGRNPAVDNYRRALKEKK